MLIKYTAYTILYVPIVVKDIENANPTYSLYYTLCPNNTQGHGMHIQHIVLLYSMSLWPCKKEKKSEIMKYSDCPCSLLCDRKGQKAYSPTIMSVQSHMDLQWKRQCTQCLHDRQRRCSYTMLVYYTLCPHDRQDVHPKYCLYHSLCPNNSQEMEDAHPLYWLYYTLCPCDSQQQRGCTSIILFTLSPYDSQRHGWFSSSILITLYSMS